MAVTGQDFMNKGVMYCIWQLMDPKVTTGYHYWFAIRLSQPLNIGHGGYSAYWDIATGNYPLQPPSDGTDTIPPTMWRRVVNDAAMPYIFAATHDQCPADLKVELVPQAGGEDLSIAVTMSDMSA